MAEFTGYPIELERREELRATARPFTAGAFPQTVAAAPEAFSLVDKIRCENQGPVGRCAGFASSTGGEAIYYLKTGRTIQFNGHASYIWAQRVDGLLGGDRGSTIAGNAKAAKATGFCPHDWDGDGRDDYPLPPGYTTRIPDGASEAAAPYVIEAHAWLDSYEAILAHLKTKGPAVVGASWGGWGPDRDGTVRRFVGGRGGGHAWVILGWKADGRLEALNSHGRRFGIDGWMWLTEEFVGQLCRHGNTSIAGYTGMPEQQAIDWDFLKDSMFSTHR
ncbi:MAG: hypothetical protein WBC44_14590 [Planctomycetaceae bacterium]